MLLEELAINLVVDGQSWSVRGEPVSKTLNELIDREQLLFIKHQIFGGVSTLFFKDLQPFTSDFLLPLGIHKKSKPKIEQNLTKELIKWVNGDDADGFGNPNLPWWVIGLFLYFLLLFWHKGVEADVLIEFGRDVLTFRRSNNQLGVLPLQFFEIIVLGFYKRGFKLLHGHLRISKLSCLVESAEGFILVLVHLFLCLLKKFISLIILLTQALIEYQILGKDFLLADPIHHGQQFIRGVL